MSFIGHLFQLTLLLIVSSALRVTLTYRMTYRMTTTGCFVKTSLCSAGPSAAGRTVASHSSALGKIHCHRSLMVYNVMRSTAAEPFCKIDHQLYLGNVSRYILFAHLKLPVGQCSFQQHSPEKDPLKDDFFHQTN